MIIILHGENLTKSRSIISQLKTKLDLKTSDENLDSLKKELDIADITPSLLKETIFSYDLFSEPPFIILDISSAGRKSLDDYLEILENVPTEVTLVIYSKKELSKANFFIKNAGKLKAKVVENFQEPNSNIFAFVDAVWAKDRKKSYEEYKNLIIDGEEPFYVFTMLLFGLRNIAYAKFDSPELKRNAPFVVQKSTKQAKIHSDEKILALYHTAYHIDKNLKTGKINIEHAIPLLMEKVLT